MKALIYNDLLRIKKFKINILLVILFSVMFIHNRRISMLLLAFFVLSRELTYISVKENIRGFKNSKISNLKQMYSCKDIILEKFLLIYISTALLFLLDYILIHFFGRTNLITSFQIQIVIFYILLPIVLPIILNTNEIIATIISLGAFIIDATLFFRMGETLVQHFTITNILLIVPVIIIFTISSFFISLKMFSNKE